MSLKLDLKVVCINLKSRKDRYKYVKKILDLQNIKYSFYKAKLKKNPKLGCLQSHLNIIKESFKSNVKYLLILEDDIQFLDERKIRDISEVPDNWDMLYLGGTAKNIINKNNPKWIRMTCWNTHAYIINMTNRELVNDILKAEILGKEIDEYYLTNIHPKYNCYMINPMMIIQREDYSDIEKARVNYDFMAESFEGFSKPEHHNINGNYVLKLPIIKSEDLPKVSIITPTYNRRKMFSMAIYNYRNFDYPRDKLEWIIIDDSYEENILIDMFQYNEVEIIIQSRNSKKLNIPTTNKPIKYIRIIDNDNNNHSTIAEKRNLGVLLSKNDYIVHMDDDDYYPPESILSRVKLLLKYEHIGCVGCSSIGIFELATRNSTIASDGVLTLSEASMAYKKNFWIKQGFNNDSIIGEYKEFIQNRFDEIMDIPFNFVIISLKHSSNITNKKIKNTKDYNFYNDWNDDVKMFIDYLTLHQTK